MQLVSQMWQPYEDFGIFVDFKPVKRGKLRFLTVFFGHSQTSLSADFINRQLWIVFSDFRIFAAFSRRHKNELEIEKLSGCLSLFQGMHSGHPCTFAR